MPFRRPILTLALLVLASLLAPAAAFPAERVLVVKSGDIAPYNQALEGFRNAFGPVFETAFLEKDGSLDGFQEPDILVAIGNKAVKECQKMPVRIPLVYLMTLNMDRSSMGARSFVGIDPEVPLQEQIRFLEAHFPALLPVGVLTGREEVRSQVQKMPQASRVELEWVGGPGEVPKAFGKLIERVSSLILLPDAAVLSRDTVDFLFLSSLEKKKPILTYSEGLVQKGALVGLIAQPDAQGQVAAQHVRQGVSGLLGRQKVVSAGSPEVLLNENTARTLGIGIPGDLAGKSRVIR